MTTTIKIQLAARTSSITTKLLNYKNLEVMGIDWSNKTTAASDCANWRRIVDHCSAWNWRNWS